MATLQRNKSSIQQQPEVSDFRVLTRADLTTLTEKRSPATLQTLKDSHHRIARAVAAGLPNGEVAQHCGISYNRVSQLRGDPAFMELVAHYRGAITAEYVRGLDSFMEVATSNMLKAAVMISDKLDTAMETGETLPLTQLIALQADGADRFGYGKMQKNLNVNVDFAAQLESARKRSRSARDPSPSLAPQIEHAPHTPAAARSDPEPTTASGVSQARGPSFRRV